MKSYFKIFYLVIILQFVGCGNVMSQSRFIDSCRNIIKSNKADTVKIDTWYNLGLQQEGSEKVVSFYTGLALAKKINDVNRIVWGYRYLGKQYLLLGLKDSAYYLILKRIEIGKKTKDPVISGLAYSALFYLLATYYNNPNIAYLDTAITYLKKADDKNYLTEALLRKLEEFYVSNNFAPMKSVMDEIISIESNKKEHSFNYFWAKNLYFRSKGQLDSAIAINKILLEKYLKAGSWDFVSYLYSTLASSSCELKDYKNALKYSELGAKIASQHKLNQALMDNFGEMYLVYKAMRDYENALKVKDRILIVKDSIGTSDLEMVKSSYNLQIANEAEKRKAELYLKDKEITEVKAAKQTLALLFAGGTLILVLIFSGYVIKKWREAKRNNETIRKQKILVEQKNKEITESIEYALRIQKAILPPKKLVKQYLENSFILYKPKSIVAGDFYWMHAKDDLIFFAACDCTGHGVPGAMVSVVCHNALERAVKEFNLNTPNEILSKTSDLVVENFSKSEENMKDGMDISFCLLNTKTLELQWAGANNPLWFINNGNFIEIKANKQPIGMNESTEPYTNHIFELKKNDTIYLFSDGYADQFGGDGKSRNKKLTKKRFKELILSIQDKDMALQGVELNNFITNYQKSHEQIDDILVIGVRI